MAEATLSEVRAEVSRNHIEIQSAPRCWCPSQDTFWYGEEEYDVTVLAAARDEFMHIIPSFDVVAIPLKHLRVKGISGQELEYDIFIHNCSSLDRHYPAQLIIKDVVIVKVSCTAVIMHAQNHIKFMNSFNMKLMFR